MNRIAALEITRYPPNGSVSGLGYDIISHENPSWETIEAAIRRLDRDEFPFVWLHPITPSTDEFPENALQVVGGRGEWALTAIRDGFEVG
jgi:hypothetical protein